MNFEDFWKAYPGKSHQKGSKAEAEKKWNGLSRSLTEKMQMQHDAFRALDKYKEVLANEPWRPPMQARRWLNPVARNWECYLESDTGESVAVEEIEKRRDEIRARNRARDEAALEQWKAQYKQRFGRVPGYE